LAPAQRSQQFGNPEPPKVLIARTGFQPIGDPAGASLTAFIHRVHHTSGAVKPTSVRLHLAGSAPPRPVGALSMIPLLGLVTRQSAAPKAFSTQHAGGASRTIKCACYPRGHSILPVSQQREIDLPNAPPSPFTSICLKSNTPKRSSVFHRPCVPMAILTPNCRPLGNY